VDTKLLVMVCDEEKLKSLLTSQNGSADNVLYQALLSRSTTNKSIEESYAMFFLSFLAMFNLLTNSLMIIGIWKTNKKLTNTHKLLIYTSAMDLLIAFFVVPFFIASRLLVKNSCFNVMIAMSVGIFITEDSKQTIFTLSIMRYISLHSPLRRIRNSSIIKVAFLQMLIAIAMSVLNFCLYYLTTNLKSYTAEWLIFSLFTIACILAAVICNLLSRHTLLNKKDIQQSEQHLERHGKAVKRLLLICLCNILCYSPNSFYQLYAGIVSAIDSSINLQDIASITMTLDLLYLVMMLSPALNSLVYVLWNKKILRYYKQVLTTKKRRFLT